MKKTSQIFLIILLLSASSLSAEESLPPPFEASYKIFTKGIEVAKMHHSLRRSDNGEFIYRSETNLTGLASIFYKLHVLEESHWHLQGQLLQPLSYSYKRTKKKKENHKKTVFDWKNNQANLVINGIKSTLNIQPGMTDKLLYQIEIMRDLKVGHQPDDYTVVDGTKIKTYHFEYLGEEFLETPLGKLKTIKMVRHKPGTKETLILWCANKLHYLPVKVETTDDDGFVTTAMINKLTGLGSSKKNYSSAEFFK